jgi:hypothetical protein
MQPLEPTPIPPPVPSKKPIRMPTMPWKRKKAA